MPGSRDPELGRAAREWRVAGWLIVAAAAVAFGGLAASSSGVMWGAEAALVAIAVVGRHRACQAARRITDRVAAEAGTMDPETRTAALIELEDRLPPCRAIAELHDALEALPAGLSPAYEPQWKRRARAERDRSLTRRLVRRVREGR